jgi:hypothetical protein
VSGVLSALCVVERGGGYLCGIFRILGVDVELVTEVAERRPQWLGCQVSAGFRWSVAVSVAPPEAPDRDGGKDSGGERAGDDRA